MKVLSGLLSFLHLSLVTYATVQMTISKTLVTVKEKEARRKMLIDDTDPILCSDTDGDNTRASLVSVTPDGTCSKCFALEPCLTDATRYCLLFQPSKGNMDYSKVTSYIATIRCTDDKETPVTGTVHIQLEANAPPVFEPVANGLYESDIVGVTRTKRIGSKIHTVSVTDTENDALFFSMYTTPATDLFTIGYGSGVIKAKRDLRFLCFSPVTFYVSMWDSYHAAVGPKVIQIKFNGKNDRPVIKNTEQTIRIAEDTPVDDPVLTLDVTDSLSYPSLTYEMTADPVDGLDIYKMDDGNVRVRRQLDYEYTPLREVTLTMRAFDGFCYSEYYVVRVIITDVNEDFQLSALTMNPSVDEGLITYATNITIWDQDEETHHFFRLSGNAMLQVEGTTGIITSKGVVDTDPSDKKTFDMKIEITDEASPSPHSQELQVSMTIRDINDNRPAFKKSVFPIKVDTCTEKGEIVGNLVAGDDDSALDGNNYLVYSGNSKSFAVLSDGKVIYTSLLTVGEVNTGSVHVTDQGLKPGALAGIPATVTVECELCPTTTTVVAPTGAVQTTKFTVPKNAKAREVLKATDTSTNQRDIISANVGWISAGAIVFLLLCFLLASVIYFAIGSAQAHVISEKPAKPARPPARRPMLKRPGNNQQLSDSNAANTTGQQPHQQPRPPPAPKPRAQVAAVSMLPPPQPYERVFIDGQTPPAGNDVTTHPQPQDRTFVKERIRAEPELAKPGGELSKKPQMQIGEYIDLEVITPRNSPLPYVQ